MGPAKHVELQPVMLLNQTQYKHAESCQIQGKGDEPVVFTENAQRLLSLDQSEEVVRHCLPIEEVVHTQEKVPAEGPEPGQVVGVVYIVANSDYFMETLNLNTHNNHHQNHWSQVNDNEEKRNHGQRQDASHPPVLPS